MPQRMTSVLRPTGARMWTFGIVGIASLWLLFQTGPARADDPPAAESAIPARHSDDYAFNRANPDFASDFGSAWERERLGNAVRGLAEACPRGGADPEKFRDILRNFIYDWLDLVIEGNGVLSTRAAFTLRLALDDSFRGLLQAGEFPAYCVWRDRADGENPLGFIMTGAGVGHLFPPPSPRVLADRTRLPLKLRKHPIRLLAENVTYEGQRVACLPSQAESWTPAAHCGSSTLLLYKWLGPPIARHDGTGELVRFDFWSLAESAGWYRSDGSCLPDGVYGLAQCGGRLWMGTSGMGILALDLAKRSWSRYDVKEVPIPGDHHGVIWGDEEYVFTSRGCRRQLPPEVAASLLVYSLRHEAWLAIEAVPTRDALGLGESSLKFEPEAQVPVSFSPYVDSSYVPLSPSRSCLGAPHTIQRRDEDVYSLVYSYGRRVYAELGLRRDLLAEAFDAAALGK